MGLQAQAPAGPGLHELQGQGLPFAAVPAGLKQPGRLGGLAGADLGKEQVGGVVHDHLELIAALQQLRPRRLVALGREADPIRRATEGIDAAGFQVNRQRAALADGRAEGIEVVVQRFSAGDHHEGRPRVSRLGRGVGQGFGALLRVGRDGPGVLGVAPAAAHRAAPKTDEKGAAPGMDPLPLQGVEGLHDGKRG